MGAQVAKGVMVAVEAAPGLVALNVKLRARVSAMGARVVAKVVA